MVSQHLTIGRLARIAGVPVSTVRYYERRGLLDPAGRSEGNYRLYDDHDVTQLRFIRCAQTAGFSLEDIRLLLDLRTGGAPCRSVQEVIDRRLTMTRNELERLRRIEAALVSARKHCESPPPDGHCEVLRELEALATDPHPGIRP